MKLATASNASSYLWTVFWDLIKNKICLSEWLPCDVDYLSDGVKNGKCDSFVIDNEDYSCGGGEYPADNGANDPA